MVVILSSASWYQHVSPETSNVPVLLGFCCLCMLFILLYKWRLALLPNPEWLECMKGEESALLSNSDYNFVSDVHSMIQRGETSEDDISPVTRSVVSKELPRIKDNFVEIVQFLKRSSSERRRFLKTYLRWRGSRRNTVEQLKKIADSIDNDKENCKMTRIFGGVVSLLGGGLYLFSGYKDREIYQTIGKLLMGAGNLTNAGTSLVGEILLHKNIKAARNAIEEDREYTKNLWTWVEETNDLFSALDNIQSTHVDRSLQDAARSLRAVHKKKMEATRKQSEVKVILKSFKCPPELRNELADVVGMMVSTFILYDKFRPVLDLAVEGLNCRPRLRLAMGLFQSAALLNTALGFSRNVWLTRAQRLKLVGGMVVDAVTVALTLLEKDSKSVESKEIRQAVGALKDEADTFKKIYNGMKKFNDLEDKRIAFATHSSS